MNNRVPLDEGNDFLEPVWSDIYLCPGGTTAISRWLSDSDTTG